MKRFKLFSSLSVLLVLSLLASPLQTLAGAAFFNVTNTTTSKTYNRSFVHNTSANTSCGGVYTHYMSANLGTVNNSSVRVNNHKVRPVISSGKVAGGMATLHDTENSSNTVSKSTIFALALPNNSTHTITWSKTMNWQPINRAVQIQQRLQPGGAGSGTHCIEGDSFTFFHSSSLLSTGNDLVEDLNFEVKKINSQKLSSLMENVNELGYNKSSESNEHLTYSEMFNNGEDFLDITISDGKIELLDVIDRININDIEILITKNIEGTNVYSVELKEEDHFIYLYTTMDYEDLLQIVD